MQVTIATAQFAYAGLDRLDITIKSAGYPGIFLAPTWELVGGHKHQADPANPKWHRYAPLTDEQYTERYLELLRYRYKQESRHFQAILHLQFITLVCYCPAGAFCHRHIAQEVLQKIAVARGYTVSLLPEREIKNG